VNTISLLRSARSDLTISRAPSSSAGRENWQVELSLWENENWREVTTVPVLELLEEEEEEEEEELSLCLLTLRLGDTSTVAHVSRSVQTQELTSTIPNSHLT